jgi:hypothetical protein
MGNLEVQLEVQLQDLARNLEFNKFKNAFDNYENKYGIPDVCLISELFKNYPSVEAKNYLNEDIIKIRNKNENKIQLFIEFLVQRGFTFEDLILKRKHDEVIKFNKLYDTIGYEYTGIDGNNILHMQTAGLHCEGVAFLINDSADANMVNSSGYTPLELLFMEDYPSYKFESAYEDKIKMATILKEKTDIRPFTEQSNLLTDILEYQIYINKKVNLQDLDIVSKVFNLKGLLAILNISRFYSNMLEHKNIYSENDFNNIDIIKKHFNV